MADPGWVRDPSGRYRQRYFDGTAWTEHVADEYGNQALDPVPVTTRPSVRAGAPPATQRPASGDPSGAAARPAGPGGAIQLSLPILMLYGGALLTFVAFVFLPWLEDSEAVSLMGDIRAAFPFLVGFGGEETEDLSGWGVWESSFFDAGWIITLAVVGVAIVQVRAGHVRRVPAIAVALGGCARWALVGSLMLRSWIDDVASAVGESSASLSVGFYLALVGIVAVAAAPFVPDQR